MFAVSPTRRCSATPSGTASIWRRGAGAIAKRWFRQAIGMSRVDAGRNWRKRSMRWPRISRARPRARRADRRLVAEPAGMDADAICRRQGRAHSRHHQSRLSPERTRIRAGQSRLRRDRHRDRVQDLQLHGDAEHADAGACESAAGRSARGAAAATARGDPGRRPGLSRHDRVRRSRADGRRAPPRRARGAGQDPAIRRPRQYPVHQRHHGIAQGRHADASQHPQQRLFRRPRDAPDRDRPHLHSGAALSLLRHGDGQSRRRHLGRGHGLSRRGFRSAGDVADHRAGKMHDALRRADHVHRRTRSSRLRQIRSVVAAHRHHGRRALPDRGDAAGQRIR